MKRIPSNQVHEFTTINEIFNFVTAENVDDFLQDFGTMLKNSISIRESMEELTKTLNLPLEDLEITSFSWKDDGKDEGGLTISVTNEI